MINLFKKNITFEIGYIKLRQLYYECLFSDKKLIIKQCRDTLCREVNLVQPERFTDKIQWLKLNWFDPFAIKCSDKYTVRKIIKEKIGAEYLNELIAVYKSEKEININNLPNSFVLKITKGSGQNIICKDKEKLNWNEELKEIKRWLNYNYYLKSREWVYKGKPTIICEKYISDNNNNGLSDYKFYCFNGNPIYCQVIRGRGINETIDFYDIHWKHMPFTGLRSYPNSSTNYEKPEKYEKMIELAKTLSKGFPFVRVDFYYVEKRIIFGELTFFPMSGLGKFNPDKWDYELGKHLVLPKNNNYKG